MSGKPAATKASGRQADQQSEHGPGRPETAGRSPLPARLAQRATKTHHGDGGQDESDADQPGRPRSQTGFGMNRPRLLSSEPNGSMIAVARPRQDRQHAEIPEEDDQQRRNVAEDLDIDRGRSCGSASCATAGRCRRGSRGCVAVMMPATATSSVLRRPTISASS